MLIRRETGVSDYAASAAKALCRVGQLLGTVLEVVGRLVSRATADCSRGSSRDEWRGHASGVAAAAAKPAASAPAAAARSLEESRDGPVCGQLAVGVLEGRLPRSHLVDGVSNRGVGDDRAGGPVVGSPSGA
jgi:hypothetical protein